MIGFEDLIERRIHAEQDDDSHIERDATTFHPSQLARCKRQATLSKFGLDDHDTQTLGRFWIGTTIHEWLEESFEHRLDGVEFEKKVSHHVEYTGGAVKTVVHITGHADVYDAHENAVYDFKTRSGWYKFDPPEDRHLDQLTLYMAALGADKALVVYISKNDLEVRTYPEDGFFEFDEERYEDLIEKAKEMKDAFEEAGVPETVEEVPFEPCGCWLCESEQEAAAND
jgi:hypothetical protein